MSDEFATARSGARKREENDNDERRTYTKGYDGVRLHLVLRRALRGSGGG